VGANYSFAQYYPSGVVQNISEQSLINNGWVKTYEQTYATLIPNPQTNLRPSGQYTILAGKSVGSNTITLAAAAPTASVFTYTTANTPSFVNGAYWYYTPDINIAAPNTGSMGFSGGATINQGTADTINTEAETRLSWNIGSGFNIGGYRLGSELGLNNSVAFLKQVWTWTPSLAKTSGFYFSDSYSANQSHFLSDPDGQLRATVDYIKQKFGSLIKW
jgi:hypothetical protein